MIEYIIAIIAVAVLAWLIKARTTAKEAALAFITFIVMTFIWGAIAGYFGLKPSGIVETILYSLVAFLLFWVVWTKWGRSAAR